MSAVEALRAHVEAVETAYEFMLAYAAQGLSGDEGSGPTGELRERLERLHTALAELPDVLRAVVRERKPAAGAQHAAFIDVLERDAAAADAGVRLVLAQPAISSQLVDNLNATIHVRAVLTGLFVIDEILRPGEGA